MTAPHIGPSLSAPDVDSAIDALRARGLRVSAARRLVLEALYAAGRPISADEIAEGVAGRLPRSDLASVYRNLELLESVGLVRHRHLGHGPGLYSPTGVGEQEYLVCDSCSNVVAVERSELDPVRDYVRQRFGYEAAFSHFPILGLCAECTREESLAPTREDGRA